MSKVNMVWKCPLQIFSTHIGGSCRNIKIKLKSNVAVFSHLTVVGNLTTIMTQLICDGNMIIVHFFGWHVRAHLNNKARAYTFTHLKQLWQSPTSTTCPILVVLNGCSPIMVTTPLHHLKFLMMWLRLPRCVYLCSWSIYNVVVYNDHLHWGWLMHIVNVHQHKQFTNCLRHLFVLCPFGVFNYKHVTKYNNIPYLLNLRCMFIIAHGHIPQHTLQLHCT